MPRTNQKRKSGKESTAIQPEAESSYAKRQRRRANAIIAASGCYSAAFRAEVQQALDTDPLQLRVLFREADEIDQKLASAGRSIRATLRKEGIPFGESDVTGRERPLNRSQKHVTLRLADEIESLFIASENGRLDEDAADDARLIGDILYDIGSESQVCGTHPRLVKAYVLAIFDKLSELDQHSYETVQGAFAAVRDLMSGCSEARFEEISRRWNSFLYKDGETQDESEQASAEIETEQPESQESPALTGLREKLANLEDLPENEAVSFRLESEIYQLECDAAAEKWPDLIGGGHV